MRAPMQIERLTRVSFEPRLAPGWRAPTVLLSFGEFLTERVPFTAVALAALPLSIARRIRDDAEVIWLNHTLQSAARSAVEDEIGVEVYSCELNRWTPDWLRWTPTLRCDRCFEHEEGEEGCAHCKWGLRIGEPFHTDLDGRLIETPCGEQA